MLEILLLAIGTITAVISIIFILFGFGTVGITAGYKIF